MDVKILLAGDDVKNFKSFTGVLEPRDPGPSKLHLKCENKNCCSFSVQKTTAQLVLKEPSHCDSDEIKLSGHFVLIASARKNPWNIFGIEWEQYKLFQYRWFLLGGSLSTLIMSLGLVLRNLQKDHKIKEKEQAAPSSKRLEHSKKFGDGQPQEFYVISKTRETPVEGEKSESPKNTNVEIAMSKLFDSVKSVAQEPSAIDKSLSPEQIKALEESGVLAGLAQNLVSEVETTEDNGKYSKMTLDGEFIFDAEDLIDPSKKDKT